MPIYEYACSACEHRSDILHGIHDPGPRFCPSCGKEGTMRKVFAAPAVHFKGSGWAKKDRAATAVPGKSKKQEKAGDGATSADAPSSGDAARSSAATPSKSGGDDD